MMRNSTLVMSSLHHAPVKAHLFPGDGKEAAVILLCSRISGGERIKLLVHDYVLVPYDGCDRHPDFLSWSSVFVEQALDLADQDDLSIILLHSHPGGLFAFSHADLESDATVMPAIFAARSKGRTEPILHGSAIMLASGVMRAQLYDEGCSAEPVDLIAVYGEDIRFFWNPDKFTSTIADRPLAFSNAMGNELGHLSACVVGVSGTGSLVAEQVARLGFGEVILIDYDRVEKKNLNRILNSTLNDANVGRLKVDVISDAIHSFRTNVSVKVVPFGVGCNDAIMQASLADVVFCCVDSQEGRQICDLMASAFLQPLFDVGVTIPVRQSRPETFSILDVVGRVDYVWPGGSTLANRGVFTPSSVAAEYLARTDPVAHAARVLEGYMPGSHEEAPSVISLNMLAASTSVMEFIARAFPFRHDPNSLRARTQFSLAACEEEYTAETDFVVTKNPTLGTGLKRPLLGLPFIEG